MKQKQTNSGRYGRASGTGCAASKQVGAQKIGQRHHGTFTASKLEKDRPATSTSNARKGNTFIASEQEKSRKETFTSDIDGSRSCNKKAKDPWAFLVCTEAPQWTDLSVEGSLITEVGDDPWFHKNHKYHTISLARLNSRLTWLRLGHTFRTKSDSVEETQRKLRSTHVATSKPKRGTGKENEPPKHGQAQNVLASVNVKDMNRFSCARDMKNALFGGKRVFGSTCIENEHCKLDRNHSCNSTNLSTVSDSPGAGMESNKWINKESPTAGHISTNNNTFSRVKKNSVHSSITPTWGDSMFQKYPNLFGASRLECSSEVCRPNTRSSEYSTDMSVITSGSASTEKHITSICKRCSSECSRSSSVRSKYSVASMKPKHKMQSGKCEVANRKSTSEGSFGNCRSGKNLPIHAPECMQASATRMTSDWDSHIGHSGEILNPNSSAVQCTKGEGRFQRIIPLMEWPMNYADLSVRSKQELQFTSRVHCKQAELQADKKVNPKDFGYRSEMPYTRSTRALRSGLKRGDTCKPAPSHKNESETSKQCFAALIAQHNKKVRARTAAVHQGVKTTKP